jgi:1-acyl-sn-glycerol-3-phosphate acyltransferase
MGTVQSKGSEKMKASTKEKQEETMKAAKTKTNDVIEYVDYCSLSVEQIRKMAGGTDEDREGAFIPLINNEKQDDYGKNTTLSFMVSKDDVLKVQKMNFWEETLCVLFLAFVVPNGIFTIPPTLFLIGKFLVGDIKLTFIVFGLFLVPLVILPQAFIPSRLQSFLAIQVCKYFSFRFVIEQRPECPPPPSSLNNKDNKDNDNIYRPSIMVAPPHGVFPYGNILSVLSFPALHGCTFRGLASSAALRPPIFKQILRSIGIVDASRHVARNTLENGESIGISTGGVAEIFFTNDDDECILLKERIGLIKLAIRTGTNIVPCYLFGNTKLLNCWAGEGIPGGRYILEKISRKLGFALIIIHGRFFLPIPFRKPILGVMSKPIPTHHIQNENPTPEQIETIQKQLLEEMERIFDTYKHLYGWDDKKLIIK